MTNETFDPNSMWGQRETVGPDPDEAQPVTTSFVRILIAAGAILLLSGVAVVLVVNSWGNEIAESIKTAEAERPLDPLGTISAAIKIHDAPPTNHKNPSVDWNAEEKKVANSSAIKGLRRKLSSTSSLIQNVQNSKSELGKRIKRLKASEQGAKIASSSKHIESFIWIENEYDSLDIESGEASEFIRDMQGFLQKVESRDDGSYTPQPFVSDRLSGFKVKFESERKKLTELQDALTSVVDAASELQPASLLDVALEKTRADHAATRAERIATGAKEGRQNATANLVEKSKAASKDLTTSEINLVNAKKTKAALKNNTDADEILAELELQIENDRIAAAKRVLEQEFQRDLTDIKTYLAPFLADGRTHRGGSPGAGPISYSYLTGKVVFDNTPQGLANFGIVGYSIRRNLGGFPGPVAVDRMKTGYPNSEPTAQFLERAQHLLKKYGELLVEKGMLAE